MRVAVCQMNSGADLDANVDEAIRLLTEAADGGADLAALPEYFAYLGSDHGSVAESIPDGPISTRLAGLARERSMWVLGGTLAERDGDHLYDTSALFDRSGGLAARYRKIHLYDVDLPDQPPFRESATFAHGDEVVTAETEFGRVGLAICYDLRFPELFRGLMSVGSEVMLLPSQFQHYTGQAHWDVLIRSRAIEDQCFVVAPAQWGPYGDPDVGRRSFGHSIVVDPWGRVLVEAPEEGTGVSFAELDFTELRRIRSTLPALQHRRLGIVC